MNTVPVLEICELSFAYPDGTQALKNINLTLMPGETVALLGPNGAGKSTLLLHLNGIFESEQVKIKGLPANSSNLIEIRRLVGLIFQDPDDQLFSPTVYDDVAFGPLNLGFSKDDINQRVDKALSEVGLSPLAQKPPHHLSFGEKKRASVATVLPMEPELLVLDEPTSNLDPLNRRNMINLIKQLSPTKIIATHDLEMVVDLQAQVVILDKGEIVAQGTADDILANEELLLKHSLELPWSFRYSGRSA